MERLSEKYIEWEIGKQEVKRKRDQPEKEENIWKQEYKWKKNNNYCTKEKSYPNDPQKFTPPLQLWNALTP